MSNPVGSSGTNPANSSQSYGPITRPHHVPGHPRRLVDGRVVPFSPYQHPPQNSQVGLGSSGRNVSVEIPPDLIRASASSRLPPVPPTTTSPRSQASPRASASQVLPQMGLRETTNSSELSSFPGTPNSDRAPPLPTLHPYDVEAAVNSEPSQDTPPPPLPAPYVPPPVPGAPPGQELDRLMAIANDWLAGLGEASVARPLLPPATPVQRPDGDLPPSSEDR